MKRRSGWAILIRLRAHFQFGLQPWSHTSHWENRRKKLPKTTTTKQCALTWEGGGTVPRHFSGLSVALLCLFHLFKTYVVASHCLQPLFVFKVGFFNLTGLID